MVDPRIEEIRQRKSHVYGGGGPELIAKQHDAGERTTDIPARSRY